MKRLFQTIFFCLISLYIYSQPCWFWPKFDSATRTASIPFGNTVTFNHINPVNFYGLFPYDTINPSNYFTPDPGITTFSPPNPTTHSLNDLGVFSIFPVMTGETGTISFSNLTTTGFFLHVIQPLSRIDFDQSFTLISSDGDLIVGNSNGLSSNVLIPIIGPGDSEDDGNVTIFFAAGITQIDYILTALYNGDGFCFAFTFPDSCINTINTTQGICKSSFGFRNIDNSRVSIQANSPGTLHQLYDTSGFTWEAWVKLNSPIINGSSIISTEDDVYAQDIVLGFGWGGTPNALCFHVSENGPGGTTVAAESLQAINLNNWYHIAGVCDYANAIIKLYLNGNLLATNVIPADILNNRLSNDILTQIGNLSHFYPNGINGNVDEVRFWNTVRTQTEIQNAMSQCLTVPQNGLVAYFKADENMLLTANNAVNTNFTGLLENATWSTQVPAVTCSSITIIDSLTGCNNYNFYGLINNVNASFITNWQWYFGDGDTANTQNTNHTYAVAGSYIVKLVVTDSNGCKDSTFKSINAAIQITSPTADTTICSGNNLMLSVNLPSSLADTILSPGSQFEYKFDTPSNGWTNTTGGWASGNAPFGNLTNGSPPEFNYNTYWPSGIPEGVDGLDLHVRTNINLSGYDLSTIHWYLGVDNGFTLYINGTPVDSAFLDGYTGRWEYSGIIPGSLLNSGNNIIAVGLVDNAESTAFDMMITGQRINSGGSVVWSTGDTTATITVTTNQTTTYYVMVTNGPVICTDSIKVSVKFPSAQLINASTCQGENYAGYTTSGIYVDTLVAANGCDSVRTINLTVNPRTFSNITQSICAGQSFEGYASTGTYIDTLVAANGCDSVRIINLTVNQRTFSNITQSICTGQSFEGYASTGIYIDTLVAANGCDSIRTINLTVNERMFSNISQSICAGQIFEGYATAGIYIDTLVAANGCDSIRTINLTVNPQSFSSITQSICAGQSFEGYASTGTYIDVLVAANGCDSVRTINLTVKLRSYLTIIQSICQGQTYLGHNTGGTYIDTLVAANGCDSIRTLQLAILPKPIPDLGIDKEICSGDSLILYPGSFSTYNWQNGSSQSHFVANQPGMYSVLVTNNCGSATDQILIKEKICHIYFPSAFTPNNDGKNELFKVLGAYNLSDYRLTVYNRWGQKVFETTDYTKGWDGKINGKLQNTGVFVWHSEFKKASNPNKIFMKGTVLLVK